MYVCMSVLCIYIQVLVVYTVDVSNALKTTDNVLNSSKSSFRSNVALIRRSWMQVLLHVVRYSVLKRLRISKFKRKAICYLAKNYISSREVKHQPADGIQGVPQNPKTIGITYC